MKTFIEVRFIYLDNYNFQVYKQWIIQITINKKI